VGFEVRRLRMSVAHFYLDIVRPILRSGRGLFGFTTILVMLLMAVVGPRIVPLDMSPKPWQAWQPPSLEHPFGTDYLGRDLFSLIIHGSVEVFLIPFLATVVGISVGVILGLYAGWKGGLTRRILTAATDVMLTIPSFPAIFILAFALPKTLWTMVILLALFSWPGLARALAAEVSSLRSRDFIEALINLNIPSYHILLREIGPHLVPFIALNFASVFVGNMSTLVGIVFLGVAPLKPTNWGYILNQMMFTYKGLLFPNTQIQIALLIGLFVYIKLGVVYFAQALEEVTNPRLRAYE